MCKASDSSVAALPRNEKVVFTKALSRPRGAVLPARPTPPHTPLAPTDAGELSAASDGPPSLAADQPPRWGPGEYALLSALLPGAGQVAQRRWGTAVVQAATVVSYLVGALALGAGDRAVWLALAWNVWSAIDAYWHAPD